MVGGNELMRYMKSTSLVGLILPVRVALNS